MFKDLFSESEVETADWIKYKKYLAVHGSDRVPIAGSWIETMTFVACFTICFAVTSTGIQETFNLKQKNKF